MNYGGTSTASGQYTIYWGGQIFTNAPPPPVCACGQPIAYRHQETGVGLCDRCAHVEDAPIALAKLFRATAPSLRAKLYRQLSIVFHPDAGGDERLMRALNAVKEQFP